MRLLVCGNRDWACVETIENWLAPFSRKYGARVVLIHGGAPGVDSIAEVVGQHFGWEIRAFPADWRAHGRAAGPIRNREMIETGRPGRALAFGQLCRGSKRTGTGDMVAALNEAGVIVTVIPRPGIMP